MAERQLSRRNKLRLLFGWEIQVCAQQDQSGRDRGGERCDHVREHETTVGEQRGGHEDGVFCECECGEGGYERGCRECGTSGCVAEIGIVVVVFDIVKAKSGRRVRTK